MWGPKGQDQMPRFEFPFFFVRGHPVELHPYASVQDLEPACAAADVEILQFIIVNDLVAVQIEELKTGA